MTDEEKAENFVKENCCEFCVNKDDCEMGCIECHTKEGVLYGLAEGRKEGYEQGKNNERELQCGKKNYEKDIARLEKRKRRTFRKLQR
ncbi:MAG: hypothetical protein KBT21_08555 [Treponema sp.]|nr:hypothetical protein [Candidatus Treponema merdequi]